MHPHIVKTQELSSTDKAYDFINKHLPDSYVLDVVKILKKKKITRSKQVIRNVRNQITTSDLIVLNALLLLAKKEKKAKETLEKNLEEQLQDQH